MRVLFITHFYPPYRDGGYAQLCQEVATSLENRGHEIHVLTSRLGAEQARLESGIYRRLHLENDLRRFSPTRFFTQWLKEERDNDHILSDLISELDPDVVFIWGMYGLSRSVPAVAERCMGDRVAYFISDMWPASNSLGDHYWQDRPSTLTRRQVKGLMAATASAMMRVRGYPPKLDFANVIVVSNAIKSSLMQSGLPLEESVVIHSGTDVEQYWCEREYSQLLDPESTMRLLYAGNVIPIKGVHTAIEAMVKILEHHPTAKITLSIAGTGDPAYEKQLRSVVSDRSLSDRVLFLGRIPRDDMPRLLEEHDVLILPSICEDALPRIVQEAMLNGLVTLGSRRGGTPEMIADKETGLLFTADDSDNLAEKIQWIERDRGFAVRLALAGQRKAIDAFSFALMAERIEEFLVDRFNGSS